MVLDMKSSLPQHVRPHASAGLCVVAALLLLCLSPVHCMTAQFRGLAEPEGVKDATVKVLNDTSFEVEGLSFSGAAPSVYWWGAKVILETTYIYLTVRSQYILCSTVGLMWPLHLSDSAVVGLTGIAELLVHIMLLSSKLLDHYK